MSPSRPRPAVRKKKKEKIPTINKIKSWQMIEYKHYCGVPIKSNET